MAIWHQTAITRLRAPLVSTGYGNSTRNWAAATSAAFLVKWSPKAASEVVGDEPQTVTRVKVSGGPEFDIEATDRVLGPDGFTYEVDGEVEQHFSPRGLHHIGVFLQRVTITV